MLNQLYLLFIENNQFFSQRLGFYNLSHLVIVLNLHLIVFFNIFCGVISFYNFECAFLFLEIFNK